MNAPIAFFCYNRPVETLKVLTALKNNPESKKTIMFAFVDELKEGDDFQDWNTVINILKNFKGFEKIVFRVRDTNFGTNKNIADGVSCVLKNNEKVIVVEDDIFVSTSFLYNMNRMLDYYKSKNIFSVTGFNYPKRLMSIPKSYVDDVYFNVYFSSWGWGTWRSQWKKFKPSFEASWDIEVSNYCYDEMLLHVYPVVSMVDNIGIHSGNNSNFILINEFSNDKLNDKELVFPKSMFLNPDIIRNYKRFENRFYRFIGKVRKVMGQ